MYAAPSSARDNSGRADFFSLALIAGFMSFSLAHGDSRCQAIFSGGTAASCSRRVQWYVNGYSAGALFPQ
jgi:hypothetical protein